VIDWAKMGEKSAKKLDIRYGNWLTIAGRTILINSSLTNSSIYHISMFLLQKTVLKRMDKGGGFFWQEVVLKRKYHLVRWQKICKSMKKRWFGY
jgi:hypothetical protein